VRLDFERRTLDLAKPIRTAYDFLEERELLIVGITDREGIMGFGEAAPLEPYDGVSIKRAQIALERYVPVLAETHGSCQQIMAACRRVDDLPQALAAIDLALWDRRGRLSCTPVAALLADDPSPRVSVNATLTASDRAGLFREAAGAASQGFSCVKLKVGIGDDVGRVAAVRAALGPEIKVRVDANGAWSVKEAVRTLEALSPAGIEFVEEPVHGMTAVREVCERVTVRVAIDETTGEPGALECGVADAVCLKISRCGGIAGLLAAAALVRASGAEPYIASAFDGPLGIAAGVHAAAALSSHKTIPHCGLATLSMFSSYSNVLTPTNGSISLPTGPGLGVEPHC
jgi:L-Ala-D/L-Glu epimerase